jgi:hypothetical protein
LLLDFHLITKNIARYEKKCYLCKSVCAFAKILKKNPCLEK